MTALSYYAGFLGFYDFSFYYVAALALRDNPHANIYDQHVLAAAATQHHVFLGTGVFQYPPLLPILFIPLTHVSFGRASQLYLIFDAALWLAGTGLVIGLLRRGLSAVERPLPSLGLRGTRPAQWLHALWAWWLRLSDGDVFALAIITFVSLTDDPLMEALRLGQASMIVFALIAVAFWLLRRELPFALGLVLAVAVMVKALPLVLVVYFILRMRWRVVLGALVGGLLLLGGMALVVGPQGLAAMRAIVGNGVGDSMRYQNEALARVPMWLGIWLTRRPSVVLLDAGYGLIALVALVFAAGVVVAGRRARRALPGRAEHISSGSLFELLGFSWAVCTMVLVSPISWVHHSAWLLPPFVLCLGVGLRALAGGIHRADGHLKPEAYVVAGLVIGILLTMYQLPFGYDRDSTLGLSELFLHHPVRPLYMLMRPLGGVLLWLASGTLFLRSSRLDTTWPAATVASPTAMSGHDAVPTIAWRLRGVEQG